MQSGKQIWAGRVISALAVLFFIFDGVSKVISLRLEGDKIVHHNGAASNEQAMAQIEEIVKM